MPLHLVKPQSQLWDQLLEESPEAYAVFAGWLITPPSKRQQPVGQLPEKYRWAERAAAYDRWAATPKKARDQLEQAFSDLYAVLAIEAHKLHGEVHERSERVLTVKEVITLAAFFSETKEILTRILGESEGKLDLSLCSDEELKLLMSLRDRMRHAG